MVACDFAGNARAHGAHRGLGMHEEAQHRRGTGGGRSFDAGVTISFCRNLRSVASLRSSGSLLRLSP